METNIKIYIYIDIDSINSAYNQIPNNVLPAKVIETKRMGGALKSDLGLGSKKLISGEIGSQVDSSRETKIEIQEQLTSEDKIESILEYINNGRIDNLSDILRNHRRMNGNLIACKSLFRFIRAYDDNEKCYVRQSDINRDPLKYTNLSFIFGTTQNLHSYTDSDDVMRRALATGEYYVDMFFSGSKMTRSVRHLTNNIQYGKDFILCVLGEITSENNNIYCIKPYAIWRMTDNNI